jgi:hypothetical protein
MAVRGRVSVTIAGSAELAARLRAAGEAGIRGAEAGLFAAGNVIMEDAKRRAPVDLGNLKGSGYVADPERAATGVTIEVGFGGPAAAYAVVQHERLDYHHDVGEAKYLERAIDAKKDEAFAAMARVAADTLEAA